MLSGFSRLLSSGPSRITHQALIASSEEPAALRAVLASETTITAPPAGNVGWQQPLAWSAMSVHVHNDSTAYHRVSVDFADVPLTWLG